MNTNVYLLIEYPDCCCGNCPKALSIFTDPESREEATIKLLYGASPNIPARDKQTLKEIGILRDTGKLSFEGDPPIEWIDAYLDPALCARLSN